MKQSIIFKTAIILCACLSLSGLIFGGSAGTTPSAPSVAGTHAFASESKTRIDTPQIFCASSAQGSINITVCATNLGANSTGLPAGFSLQWMSCDEYAANGNQWFASDDPRLCKASFSGNANTSRYALAPGECVTVNIGNFLFDVGTSTNCSGTLQCGTCYLFRGFGHATSDLNRSDFTNNLNCSTSGCGGPCDNGECRNCCVVAIAVNWRASGPPGCAEVTTNQWPATSLMLGTVTYTDTQLCQILNTPADGNGLIALAQELIAVKLNELSINNQIQRNGFPCCGFTDEGLARYASYVADADALIGGKVIPPFGNGFLDSTVTDSLVTRIRTHSFGPCAVDGCPD